MKIMTTTIRKIVDYILLNACSVKSFGLYNGKSGVALALFEVARYLEDEYIEEKAFELLQETLVSNTNDISFENGLSGIGYVLLYLIREKLIDADFDGIYGQQYETILTNIERRAQNPLALQKFIRVNYFLSELRYFKACEKKINDGMELIFMSTEKYLTNQFLHFTELQYDNEKMAVLSKFETYLKVVSDCGYTNYSISLLDEYAMIYRSGRIISSLPVSFYLNRLKQNERFHDVIAANNYYSNRDLLNKLSLRKWIERFQYGECGRKVKLPFISDDDNISNEMLSLIPSKVFIAGYGEGLGRLLILLTNYNKNLL